MCASGLRPASWGSQRGGARAGDRLKPDVTITTAGDRPPRLSVCDIAFEGMREFLVLT